MRWGAGSRARLRWWARQKVASPARYYGDGGTIHSTTHLDVEVDDDGLVVAVWFRCQTLPFQVWNRNVPRAERDGDPRFTSDLTPGKIHGLEIE